MSFDQYFAKERKSIPGAAPAATSSCFNCNICLEFARDPVVTLCGHLYCWACIYKWFHVQSASLASDEHPQCPVCKADVSHTTVVPLYGRGESPAIVEPEASPTYGDMYIPPRPPALGTQTLIPASNSGQQLPYRNPYQNTYNSPQHYSSDIEEDSSPSNLHNNNGNSAAMSRYNPMVGMFGEIVFGNSGRLYTYPNSYHPSNPRLRRQEIEADKSLSRISLFLICCFLLCLFLF